MSLTEHAPPDSQPLGVQRPRILHLPPSYCSTAGDEFIFLADSAGLILDEWQRFDLRAMTLEMVDPLRGGELRWAAIENAEIVPRQNGKGAIITALELGFLFHVRMPLVLHTAHETRTAKEGFQRLLDVIDGSDELRKQVVRVSRARGDEGLELTGSRRLHVVARTSGAGRGLSAPALIWDEAYALTDEQVAAQMPVMLAQANPWVGYFSSSAKRSSTQLHALRRRALSGEPDRLVYVERSADPDLYGGRDSDGWREARLRPEVWAVANPSLGRRIGHDSIATLLRSMAEDVADRELLGVPDDPPETAGGVLSPARWQALADPKSEWVGVPVGVADVSPDGRCSLALAGLRADGRRHVELVDNRAGTGWVAAERARLATKYGAGTWLRDPQSAAVELDGEWRDLTGREWAEASGGFVRAVQQDGIPSSDELRWRCAEDLAPVLLAAVLGGAMRDRADGGSVWTRRRSGVDISPLVALTIGWWAAGEIKSGDPLLSMW